MANSSPTAAGPYCVYADDAVAVLRANGRKATRPLRGLPGVVAFRTPGANRYPDRTRKIFAAITVGCAVDSRGQEEP